RLGVDLFGEVADRQDPDEALLVAHEHTAYRAVTHEQGGRVDGVLRAHGDQLPAHDLADRGARRIAALGDRAYHDVPVGHQPHQGGAVGHHDVADVLFPHGPGGFGERRLARQVHDVAGHDVADDLGCHAPVVPTHSRS